MRNGKNVRKRTVYVWCLCHTWRTEWSPLEEIINKFHTNIVSVSPPNLVSLNLEKKLVNPIKIKSG